MKAELIANIITAHCSGDEALFKNAVEALAADEDKKGNARVSNLLLAAYKGKPVTMMKKPEVAASQQPTGYAVQSAGSAFAPRDKDSFLELYDIIHPETSLDSVVLPENQKQLIRQILKEQENNAKLASHHLPPANRLLLCGPPGCGKTMTAFAIAHELGLPMAYVRIDGLVSSYLGQTSVNLRRIFSSVNAQKIVLFLDEFDAIAKKRDDSHEMGELKRVVTALLQNFDNMSEDVFLIAATNHEHLLDPAIWRRFNYVISIENPEEDQRKELIRRWLEEYRVEHSINVDKLTNLTAGRSAAQIKELIMSAGKRYVTTDTPISTDDMIELLIQQMTNNSSGAGVLDAADELHKKGVSVRALAKAIGMKHNTLNYQLNKMNGTEEGQE